MASYFCSGPFLSMLTNQRKRKMKEDVDDFANDGGEE